MEAAAGTPWATPVFCASKQECTAVGAHVGRWLQFLGHGFKCVTYYSVCVCPRGWWHLWTENCMRDAFASTYGSGLGLGMHSPLCSTGPNGDRAPSPCQDTWGWRALAATFGVSLLVCNQGLTCEPRPEGDGEQVPGVAMSQLRDMRPSAAWS